MKRQQTPGRIEALRAVLHNGVNNSTPEMLHVAGFGRPIVQRPPGPELGRITLASGFEKLSQQELAALPF